MGQEQERRINYPQNLAEVGTSWAPFYRIEGMRSLLLNMRKGPARKRILTLGIILIILSLSYISLHHYIRSIVDDTEIDILEIRIVNSTVDSLEVELDVMVVNPSPVASDLGSSHLDLIYEDVLIGDISLPSLHLNSGENRITVDTTLREKDRGMMLNLTREVLAGEDTNITIRGEMRSTGIFPMDLEIDKKITIQSDDEMDIEITGVSIFRSTSEEITGEVTVVIDNPSIIETTLEELEFHVLHNETILSTVSTSGYLGTGLNSLTFQFMIREEASGMLPSILPTLMNGDPLEFDLTGNDASGSLLSFLSTGFSFNHLENGTMAVLDKMDMEVQEISLFETDESGVSGSMLVTLDNPSIIEAALDGLSFDLTHNNVVFAQAMPQGSLERGDNTLSASIFIKGDASEGYNTLIGSLLAGESSTIGIRVHQGGHGTDLLSRIIADIGYDHVILPEDRVTSLVSSLDISPGLFTTTIDVAAVVNNPTPISIDLSDYRITAYYEGNYLGNIDLSEPWINTGYQTESVSLTISTISLQNLELLAKLATDDPIEIVIVGSYTFDPENILIFSMTTIVR